ncbi:aspartyl-phosphate phosphatase Spo0E family protein [Alicyclobacillus fastidiosus]|uniref:Aspartyl-phosphate phosphatase Spo0E family protein n=1 Tax=Alicyclobacillus fastidiosus TaxID=392011 RepID=A0ABV5AAV2_9BACL|nr:aspartyl-phosphate phosphatase Spo0E family protein [Alicyclobacillus fastidiosus]WEH11832.1 aspartyl-phosphate phosphatase Spo0E family protein [Alicyclobacillus fastidiosus]
MEALENEIEQLRTMMISVAEQKGNLCDPEVVQISQQLDSWIVVAQQFMPH